jgi:tetratricopeptide (TPR) repeat protein
LKKLTFQLQPYHEATKVIKEIQNECSIKKKEEIRILGHLISYAEHQFGDRVLGKAYRERGNGERIDNWRVEIVILVSTCMDLMEVYDKNESLSMVANDDLTFPYYQKMLELLRPWCTHLDVNRTSHTDSLDKDQIHYTIYHFVKTECYIGRIHQHRNEFILAEDHCQQALSYARMFEVGEEDKTNLLYTLRQLSEDKTKLLCFTLSQLSELRNFQGDYGGALAFAEESYNCAAVTYNPVHPEVQKAADRLIECLTLKGDFYDAERFAEATLDSLKDTANGLDQQSEAVAGGYHCLGSVIAHIKGDFVKAEMLVRESLRIRTSLYDADHIQIAISTGLLATILQFQGNLGNETKELHERCIAIDIRNYGPEGINTGHSISNLGTFYHLRADGSQTVEMRKENLLLSKSKYKEALRIFTKVLGPDNPIIKKNLSAISLISHTLSAPDHIF